MLQSKVRAMDKEKEKEQNVWLIRYVCDIPHDLVPKVCLDTSVSFMRFIGYSYVTGLGRFRCMGCSI